MATKKEVVSAKGGNYVLIRQRAKSDEENSTSNSMS